MCPHPECKVHENWNLAVLTCYLLSVWHIVVPVFVEWLLLTLLFSFTLFYCTFLLCASSNVPANHLPDSHVHDVLPLTLPWPSPSSLDSRREETIFCLSLGALLWDTGLANTGWMNKYKYTRTHDLYLLKTTLGGRQSNMVIPIL